MSGKVSMREMRESWMNERNAKQNNERREGASWIVSGCRLEGHDLLEEKLLEGLFGDVVFLDCELRDVRRKKAIRRDMVNQQVCSKGGGYREQ